MAVNVPVLLRGPDAPSPPPPRGGKGGGGGKLAQLTCRSWEWPPETAFYTGCAAARTLRPGGGHRLVQDVQVGLPAAAVDEDVLVLRKRPPPQEGAPLLRGGVGAPPDLNPLRTWHTCVTTPVRSRAQTRTTARARLHACSPWPSGPRDSCTRHAGRARPTMDRPGRNSRRGGLSMHAPHVCTVMWRVVLRWTTAFLSSALMKKLPPADTTAQTYAATKLSGVQACSTCAPGLRVELYILQF